MAKYFGTNGIRGKYDFLNPDFSFKVAYATGIFFKKGKILVGMDGRLTSLEIKEAVLQGLESAGCRTVDLGLVSTPTAEFMVKRLSADGLIVVTASHNPPEWNGLKIIDKNCIPLSKERGEEIEKLIDELLQKYNAQDGNAKDGNKNTKKNTGNREKYESATMDHINAIKKHIKRKKINKKILLDCANGAASIIAPYLFRELGCEVTSINSHVDGNFPGRLSEPTESNVSDLINIMKNGDYDCGIAWDGDGDRVILVDEKGNFVIGDKVFALSIMLKFKEKIGNIVTTVATSMAIQDIAKKSKAQVYLTKIGAPYIAEEFVKRNAIIGGEEVGGVMWPEISLSKDGFMTAVKIVEALEEKPLSKWLNEIPVYYNEKIKIPANDNEKIKIIKAMRDYAIKNKLNFIDIDGVRINFDDSWVIVRASGTENYIRIFTEAKTEKKAKMLLEEYEKLAKSFS